MAVEKNVILVFTACEGKALCAADTAALKKLRDKGAVFTSMVSKGDVKTLAGAGAAAGQLFWEAAAAQGLAVRGLDENFDLCVLDAGAAAADVESVLAKAMEAANRTTFITLVGKDCVIFYGPGMAKGKVVDKELCACSVASTMAYAANFPVPESCEAPVAYAAFKDINVKYNEIKKLHESIANMEAAVERKSRQPWDKHDCA